MSEYRIYDHYAQRIIEFKDIANARVVEAHPLNDHFVEVRFSDGRHGVYDMGPYLKYEIFKPLREHAFFEKLYVREEDGVVAWPGDIDIAPERMWTDMEPLRDVSVHVKADEENAGEKTTATLHIPIDEDIYFQASEYARDHGTTLAEMLRDTIGQFAEHAGKDEA